MLKFRLNDRQHLVLRKVQGRGPITAHEVAVPLGLSDRQAHATLTQLVGRGLVYHAESRGRTRAWVATSFAGKLYPLPVEAGVA